MAKQIKISENNTGDLGFGGYDLSIGTESLFRKNFASEIVKLLLAAGADVNVKHERIWRDAAVAFRRGRPH